MEAVAFVVIVAVAIFLGLIVTGTITKGRWGINFNRVTCPSCDTPMPAVRMPASGREAMWGGYTCPNCATKMDKWGRAIPH